MRFEIRTGGALAILIGLGLLSGSVFLLGLVAGYEMGRQQEGSRQFADVYPLPSPPAAVPSPAPAPESASGAESEPVAAPAPTPAPAIASVPPPVEEVPLPPPEAAAPPAPAKPKVAKPSTSSGSPEGAEPDITAPLSSPRKKGYSIQIEAVMDRGGADTMVAKLRGLGYDGYLVQTMIGGETWYRVRVGPFANEADAQAAEQKLHEAYNASLSAH